MANVFLFFFFLLNSVNASLKDGISSSQLVKVFFFLTASFPFVDLAETATATAISPVL